MSNIRTNHLLSALNLNTINPWVKVDFMKNTSLYIKILNTHIQHLFFDTHYPFRILYLPKQIQIIVVHRKTGLKCELKDFLYLYTKNLQTSHKNWFFSTHNHLDFCG